MNKKTKGLFLLAFLAVLFVSFSGTIQAAGRVPCGGDSDPCTICHLITGVWSLIDWGMKILFTIALLAATIAGVMYLVSSGSESMMNQAKSFLSSAIIGVVIVLCAWLIVNTVMLVLAADPQLGINHTWTSFSCSTASNALSGSTTAPKNDNPASAQAQNQADCSKYCSDYGYTGNDLTKCNSDCMAQKTQDQADQNQALRQACRDYWKGYFGNNTADPRYEASMATCDTVTNDGSPSSTEALKKACRDYWNKYYGNNTADPGYDQNIASCENIYSTTPQGECSSWCEQAGGNIDYTNKCKQGCYNNSNQGAGGTCGSLNTQTGINKQCGDASPALNNLLSCVNSKLGNRVTVSSVSDSNGGVNCVRDHPNWPQCPSSGTTPNCCYHSKNSQHYAQGGSQAADFVGNGASNSEISNAISACGGKPLNEGNHVHGGVTAGS